MPDLGNEDDDALLALAALEGRFAGAPPPLPPDEAELIAQLDTVHRIMTTLDGIHGSGAGAAPPPFSTWGPFELKEQIGRGTFGVVCRAFDPAVAREIAVKLYTGDELPPEPRLMARVRHLNVVTVFGAAIHEGRPGIWMELVRGRTLADRVQAQGPLSADEAVRVGIDLCGALEAVHAAHLVHQDVKARNVIEQDDGRIVLMDFGAGLARVQPGSAPSTLSGTPLYMAPEVVLGKPPSAQSDVYGLGVLLYYLLTGTYPAYAADWNELRLLHQRFRARQAAVTLRELRPDLPRRLLDVVARALEPAARRYRTAADLAAALERSRRPHRRPWAPSDWWPGRLWPPVVLAAAVGLAAGTWIGRTRQPPPPPLVLKRLTWHGGVSTDPALSADGSLLAYASDRGGDGNLDIWVQQLARGAPLRLTSDPADESQPSVSPDGAEVAFRSEREGGGVYVVPALGGQARLVARDANLPRFSPDGRWISYFEGRGFATTLVIAPLAGGPARRYAAKSPLSLTAGTWSSDSKHLLFIAVDASGTPDWWIVRVGNDAATKPFPTKAIANLHRESFNLVHGWPTPWDWRDDRVLFHAEMADTTNIWEVRLDAGSWKIQGDARPVTVSTEEQVQPSIGADGRLVFSTRNRMPYLAELTLDAQGGTARTPPRMLKRYYEDRGFHDVSADGRWLAFTSARPTQPRISLQNLQTGDETILTTTNAPLLEHFPVLGPNNAKVAYGTLDGSGRRTVCSISTEGGMPETLCESCGPPRDWSPDGRYILVQNGIADGARLAVIDLQTKRRVDVLHREDAALYRGRFSPDGRWVVFHAALPNASIRELVAPFRGATPVSPSEWVPVTDGTAWTDAANWSHDGKIIYYFSDADGFRCLWGQRVDSDTKVPVEAPFAVQHIHGRRHSVANVDILAVDLAVARDKMIFTVGELTADIWLGEVKSP